MNALILINNSQILSNSEKALVFELICANLPDDPKYNDIVYASMRMAIYYYAYAYNTKPATENRLAQAALVQSAYEIFIAEAKRSRLSQDDLKTMREDLLAAKAVQMKNNGDVFSNMVNSHALTVINNKGNFNLPSDKKNFIREAEKQIEIENEKKIAQAIFMYERALEKTLHKNQLSSVSSKILESLGYSRDSINKFQKENLRDLHKKATGRIDIVFDVTLNLDGEVVGVAFSRETTSNDIAKHMPLPSNAAEIFQSALVANNVKMPKFSDYIDDDSLKPDSDTVTVEIEMKEIMYLDD